MDRQGQQNQETARAGEDGFALCAIGSPSSLQIHATPGGCVYSIRAGEIQINQMLASPVAGGIHRIFLRLRDGGAIRARQIVGPHAQGDFAATPDCFLWRGTWEALAYQIVCRVEGARWFFDVELHNESAEEILCDLIQLQDVGLATRAQVRNNELFTSQYIDHVAARHQQHGLVVMSRQNLRQEGRFPWLLQGCTKSGGFTTSGLDFFGTCSKSHTAPAALVRESIGDTVRQDETAYVAVQSDVIRVAPRESQNVSFFAVYVDDHPAASSQIDLKLVPALRGSTPAPESISTSPPPRSLFQSADFLEAQDFTPAEIDRLFPAARHVERDGESVLSLFYGDDAKHVVFRAKELASPRPHGHILKSGAGLMPDDELLSCTCFATGAIASHLTVGNVSVGKLISAVRDPLNIVRSGGLRMFLRDEAGEWRLLGVPSAFEMAIDGCRFLYKIPGRLITVACVASPDQPEMSIDVSIDGAAVELLVSCEITSGGAEFDDSPRVSIDRAENSFTVRPAPDSFMGKRLPDAALRVTCTSGAALREIAGDELLFPDKRPRNLPYCTLQTLPTRHLTLKIRGEDRLSRPRATPAGGRAEPARFPAVITGPRLAAIADTMPWFARDAIVHLAIPHGLEQASGGAWGVRDVCQGPVEFLLAHDRPDIVAEVLRRVFAQQDPTRGDWPQWFMFPPFESIRSHDRHGDVLIWPIKALCDYLEHSADESFLEESVAGETILSRVDRVIDRVRKDFLPGLSLPKYGEGDWDDSLQPADPGLREKMVSSWTTALLYQTLRRYQSALRHFNDNRATAIGTLADDIEADYRKHLLPDGVVAGFAVFDGNRPSEFLLHPSDTRTGIHYRLISMTRGVLSGLLAGESATRHMQLLHEHLMFPDGVRLMNRPTRYSGGIETVFRRSESSANFGREIGLQYVHAHLRYAETMALLGEAEKLWKALLVVNPIAVTETVANARRRQRNCYFSSSDAAFADRYEASRDFDKLRRGEVPVDGGWRIYSSGPGIYTSLVIRHLFGIRRHFDHVEIDPVLPIELAGATCQLHFGGGPVTFEFVRGPRSVRVDQTKVPLEPESPDPQHKGVMRLKNSHLLSARHVRVGFAP